MANISKTNILTGKRKDLFFYCAMVAFPTVQFLIFYVMVNFNSVLMAFQKYDITTNTTTWTFENLTNLLSNMFSSVQYLLLIKNSLLSYALILCIGTPLGLLFSYYIYKKMPGAKGFRVFLFLPSIISAVVMVTIFTFFIDNALPNIIFKITGDRPKGFISNPETRYTAIIFYNIWISFGTSVLMYSNGMSGIDPEIVESAHLDGASGLKEFWYITLPLVYPTLSTFLIFGIATIFTNQINLYSMYAGAAPTELQTFGYYLYKMTVAARSKAEYPPLAAMGILLTCVAVPTTFLIKWLLEKFGPSVD